MSPEVEVLMVFESLVPHELYQVIWNHVTICWAEPFKSHFNPLKDCPNMVCCYPSINIDYVILVVNNIMLETFSSDAIVRPPYMSLQVFVLGLIHCMMRGIKVAAVRCGSGNKKTSLVEASYRPKIHWSGTILLLVVFFSGK